jgi:hypothetical protein
MCGSHKFTKHHFGRQDVWWHELFKTLTHKPLDYWLGLTCIGSMLDFQVMFNGTHVYPNQAKTKDSDLSGGAI